MEAIHFKQIMANDYAYLYELRCQNEKSRKEIVWYEIYVRCDKEDKLAVCIGTRSECQPSVMDSEEKFYGILAGFAYSLDKALEKYQELTKWLKTKT